MVSVHCVPVLLGKCQQGKDPTEITLLRRQLACMRQQTISGLARIVKAPELCTEALRLDTNCKSQENNLIQVLYCRNYVF